MKKTIFVLSLALYLTACDKVTNPIVKKSTAVGTSFVTKTNKDVSDSKKTLFEDYTGARCVNCPDAAKVAKGLVDNSNGNLVLIAVHADFFAKPFGEFKADYRTNIGESWYKGLGVSTNPLGIFNRTNYSNNGLAITNTKWSTVASLAESDDMVVKLDVTTNYDTLVGALNTDVKATFKKPYSGNTKISVVITEDGIVGIQDYINGVIEHYDFESMLRGSINGDWGTDLSTGTQSVGDSIKVSFPNFNMRDLNFTIANADPSKVVVKPITVNDKNVSIVVFAYDATTREILQVEKIKIR